MATIDVVGQGPNPDLLWGSSLCGWLRAGSSAVAQCSHALDVGSPGLRQLANAAEQGQRASSSNPLCLCLISHRGGDRVWALAALLSVSPGTVQYTNNHRAVCFLHYYVRKLMLPTHTGGFSLGDLPRAVLAEMTPSTTNPAAQSSSESDRSQHFPGSSLRPAGTVGRTILPGRRVAVHTDTRRVLSAYYVQQHDARMLADRVGWSTCRSLTTSHSLID